jgi:phage tail-like protein
MASFPFDSERFAYSEFNFQVSFDGARIPGVFHVGAIGWVAAHGADGGGVLGSLGSIFAGGLFGDGAPAVSYTPVQLQRERSQDTAFEIWARQASDPSTSSGTELMKTVEIHLLDETQQSAMSFILRGCTPIAYVALGPLDANSAGIAVETLTLAYRAFDRESR